MIILVTTEPEGLQCNECGEWLSNPSDVKRHATQEHGDDEWMIAPPENDDD